MKKSLIQKLGLLGIVSFLSYTAAVVFAPLVYPGYHWIKHTMKLFQSVALPKSLVPQVFLQKEKG